MDRRRFLHAAGCILTLSANGAMLAAVGCGKKDAIALGDNVSHSLLRIARLMFPFKEATEAPYRNAEWLIPIPGERAAVLEIISSAVKSLEEFCGGRFLDAGEAEQRDALASIEGSPLFLAMRFASAASVFRHRDIWALVGYEGSSVEFGGYLQRGFDDIDWLPQGGI